jgi:hypothetical protein
MRIAIFCVDMRHVLVPHGLDGWIAFSSATDDGVYVDALEVSAAIRRPQLIVN